MPLQTFDDTDLVSLKHEVIPPDSSLLKHALQLSVTLEGPRERDTVVVVMYGAVDLGYSSDCRP